MLFTQREFDIMIDELLHEETVSFDMLCNIAVKFLGPKVAKKCNEFDSLRNRGYEEDLMQDICVHLIKVTIDSFLLSKDDEGQLRFQRNPGVFGAWMNRVADNIILNFSKKVGKRDNAEDSEDKLEFFTEEELDADNAEDRIGKLKAAFDTVLNSKTKIYKKLTWLVQSLVVLNCDCTRIEAKDRVLEICEYKPLWEIYRVVLNSAAKIPWIEVTDAQHEKIMAALLKQYDESRCYGEVEYREFFMRYQGKPSGKKSISDWINRIDGEISRNDAI